MASLGDLFITVGARIDGFSAAMGDVNNALRETDRAAKASSAGWNAAFGSMQTVGLGMTAAITAPIVAIGTLSTQAFNSFELGMRQVTSLLGSVTQKEFKDLSDQTLELARAMGIDAVKASRALYEAISAGVPKENALDFVKVASVAAIAGLTDTTVAVDALTTIIAAYGLEAAEAKAISDTMFQAVNIGKFQFADLAAAIGPAAQQASNLGISYTELLGATATLSLSAGSVGQAVTQIESAMRALLNPTKEMSAALGEIGFHSGSAATKALGLEGTLEALRKQTGGNAEAFNALFGRIEGATGALGLTGTHAVKAAADLKTMGQATEGLGAATVAFNEINKSSSRQFEQLQAQVQNVAIKFGAELAPSLKLIVESMLPLLQNVQDAVKWFSNLDSSTRTSILGWVAVAAATGPLILALGTMGKSIVAVTTAAQLMGVTMAGLMTAIPWVALIASVGLLVKGLYDYKAAVDNLKGSQKEQGDALARLEISLRQQGASFGELTKQYNQGEISQTAYLKGLQAVAIEIGNAKTAQDGQTVSTGKHVKTQDELNAVQRHSIVTAEQLKKANEQLAAAFGELGLKTKDGKTKLEAMEDALKVVEKAWQKGRAPLSAYEEAVENFNEEVKKNKIHYLERAISKLNGQYAKGEIPLQSFMNESKKLNDQLALLAPKAVNLKDEFEKLFSGIKDLDAEFLKYSAEIATATLNTVDLTAVLGKLDTPIYDYKVALGEIGVKSTETMNKMAADAKRTYEAIANDPRATQWEKDNAMLRMLKAQADAMRANSIQIPADMQRTMEGLEKKVSDKMPSVKKPFDDFGIQVSTVFTDLSKDIAGILFDGDKSLGEKGKAMLDSLGKAFTRLFIEPATEALANFMAGIVKDLIGSKGFGGILDGIKSIGSAIGNVFGGGGASPVNLPDGIGNIPGAGGIPGAGAAGAAGTAASTGAMAIASLVTGIVSAVSGVIGNFQFAAMNKSLDLIEKSTRFAEIHLFYTLEKANDWWPKLGHLVDIWGAVNSVRDALDFGITDRLNDIKGLLQLSSNMELAGAGGANAGITIDLRGSTFLNDSQRDSILDDLVRRLKERGA